MNYGAINTFLKRHHGAAAAAQAERDDEYFEQRGDEVKKRATGGRQFIPKRSTRHRRIYHPDRFSLFVRRKHAAGD
jgi:hypothetical protein